MIGAILGWGLLWACVLVMCYRVVGAFRRFVRAERYPWQWWLESRLQDKWNKQNPEAVKMLFQGPPKSPSPQREEWSAVHERSCAAGEERARKARLISGAAFWTVAALVGYVLVGMPSPLRIALKVFVPMFSSVESVAITFVALTGSWGLHKWMCAVRYGSMRSGDEFDSDYAEPPYDPE